MVFTANLIFMLLLIITVYYTYSVLKSSIAQLYAKRSALFFVNLRVHRGLISLRPLHAKRKTFFFALCALYG